MEKLRTGIIGCGKVGDFHAKVYAELPQSEFVAVCDADSARAEAFASRYGVKAYTDVATMCRDARLDVVSICTPHPLHASPAVAAADCGCNVLVEKPLASSLEDCDAIIAAEKRNHVTVGTMVPILPPLHAHPQGHRGWEAGPSRAGNGDDAGLARRGLL